MSLDDLPGKPSRRLRRGALMLMMLFAALLILWMLGIVSSYTMGGFIHLLLFLAIGVVLLRIIQGRRPV